LFVDNCAYFHALQSNPCKYETYVVLVIAHVHTTVARPVSMLGKPCIRREQCKPIFHKCIISLHNVFRLYSYFRLPHLIVHLIGSPVSYLAFAWAGSLAHGLPSACCFAQMVGTPSWCLLFLVMLKQNGRLDQDVLVAFSTRNFWEFGGPLSPAYPSTQLHLALLGYHQC